MQLPNTHLLTLALWTIGTYGLPTPDPTDGSTGDGNLPQSNFAQGAIEGILGGNLGSIFHSLGWGATRKQGNRLNQLLRRDQSLGQGGDQGTSSTPEAPGETTVRQGGGEPGSPFQARGQISSDQTGVKSGSSPPTDGQTSIRRGGYDPYSDPFHVPEVEPGWKGSYSDWEVAVSQKRIKAKLGPWADELWNDWTRCMEEEIQERPDITAMHAATGSWDNNVLKDYLEFNVNDRRNTMDAILKIEDYCAEETKAETSAMAHRKAERQATRRQRTQANPTAEPADQRERELEQQRAEWPALKRKLLEERRRQRQDRISDDGLFWSRRLDVGQAGDRVLHAIAGQMKKVSGEWAKNKGGPLNGVIVPPMGGAIYAPP